MPFKVQSRVQFQPLPSARLQAPRGDFGALEADVIQQLGAGISRVGETFGRIAEEEERVRVQAEKKRIDIQRKAKDLRDKAITRDALTRYDNWLREVKTRYTTTRGKDALDINDAAKQELDKGTKTALELLENPEQRNLFESSAVSKYGLLLNQISAHQAQETLNYNMEGIQASQKNAIRNASDNFKDDDALMVYRADLDKANDELIQIQGLSPDAAKVLRDDTVSLFHTSVINQKVAANHLDAQEYYKKNVKEILPEQREKILETIQGETILQDSQAAADLITAEEEDITKWSDSAREFKFTGTPEEKAKKREKTLQLVKDEITEVKQKRAEDREDAKISVLKAVRNAKSLKEALSYIPTDMHPEDAAIAEKNARARFDIKTEAIKTKRDIQAEVYEKIDRGEITNVDQLIEYESDLSIADYNRIVTELRNKQNPDAKPAAINYNTAKTAYETVKGEKYDVETHNKEFMFIQKNLNDIAIEKGRNLTPEEARQETAKLIVTGEAIGTGFFGGDPDKTLFEAFQEDTVDVWLPIVNDNDIDGGRERKDIINALAKRGIITEDEVILRLYKKMAILNIPLSQQQADLLRKKINQIGIIRRIQR